MRGLKASASLLARWPQVHNCQSSHRQTGEGSQVTSFSLHHCFWDSIQVKICVIKLDFQTATLVYLVIAVMGGQFYFYRGHLHHTKKESLVLLCYIDERILEGLANAHHALRHQNTHIISEALSNSYEWLPINNNCKSYHSWITSTAAMPNLAALFSDVCCFALWVSHLRQLKHMPYFKHICVKTLLPSFNSNCANL